MRIGEIASSHVHPPYALYILAVVGVLGSGVEEASVEEHSVSFVDAGILQLT